jgi:hypothetical protein
MDKTYRYQEQTIRKTTSGRLEIISMRYPDGGGCPTFRTLAAAKACIDRNPEGWR